MDSESPNQPIEPEDSSEGVQPLVVASYAEEELPVEQDQPVQDDQPIEHAATNAADQRLPPQFQNVSAKGGAVAAIVLGCLAVFGAFVTQWSLFNAILGLPLGLWGLKSNLYRTSLAGICFCVIGLVLCFVMFAK